VGHRHVLYANADHTLIDVIAPGLTRSNGSPLTDDALREYATALGTSVKEGPVDKVAVVFMLETEAQAMLASCKRYGVECRAIVAGAETVLHPGQKVARRDLRDAGPRGPLLPLLREESWPHLASATHRRLLQQGNGPHASGPHVTFGWDEGDAVTRMTPDNQGDRPLADVEREALENLAQQPYKLEPMKSGGAMLMAEYGSEMILLPKVMREVQAMVGAKLIAVGVPKEGGFAAADAATGMEPLLLWTRKVFDEAKGRRVSPLPFLVQDGAIVGYASAQFSTDPAPADGTKPWWKFW